MRAAGHYHVDVFAGPKQKFVRGFTLQRTAGGAYTVWDDAGLIGTPRPISEELPVAEAFRVALSRLYEIVEKPVRLPSGPPEMKSLGYTRPKFRQMVRSMFEREPIDLEVGPDGLPVRGLELDIDEEACTVATRVTRDGIAASLLAATIGRQKSRVDRHPQQRAGDWQSIDRRLERILLSADFHAFVITLAREFPTVSFVITAGSRTIETSYDPESKEWVFEMRVATGNELQPFVESIR